MTPEEIKKVEDEVAYQANNCGGCETCLQIFGTEPYSLDPQTAWELMTHIRTVENELEAARAEVQRLREALEWYAANCSGPGLEKEYMRTPTYEVARAALAKLKPE